MQALSSSITSRRVAAPALAPKPTFSRNGVVTLRASSKPTEASPVADATPFFSPSHLLAAGAVLAPFMLQVETACADETAHEIIKGTTFALVHPAVMFSLLAATLYSAYLGWNWRSTRLLGDEIRDLRKQLPAPAADGTVVFSPIAAVIKNKEEERKALLAGKNKEKHERMGSILLAAGVGIAIEGAANTFIRTGKLFPGPHLYAGAVIVALWAFAAAMVPEMQKGNDTARNLHISANVVQVGLFLWQVPTGLDIVAKVFEFTTFP